MAKKHEFNLLKYVYGRLYAGTFEGSSIKEERKRLYSWIGSLKWLQEKGYIKNYRIIYVDKTYSTLTYEFNHKEKIYEYYLNGILRSLKVNALYKCTGEELHHDLPYLPIKKEIEKPSEFEQEFRNQCKKPVEYIGRCE